MYQYPHDFSIRFYSISIEYHKNHYKSNYDQLFCSKMWRGGEKNENNKKIVKSVENDRKMKKYFPSKFQHEL